MAEEKYARPATIADLKAVIQSLNENSVDYFLIGGYALFAHGYYQKCSSTTGGWQTLFTSKK